MIGSGVRIPDDVRKSITIEEKTTVENLGYQVLKRNDSRLAVYQGLLDELVKEPYILLLPQVVNTEEGGIPALETTMITNAAEDETDLLKTVLEEAAKNLEHKADSE